MTFSSTVNYTFLNFCFHLTFSVSLSSYAKHKVSLYSWSMSPLSTSGYLVITGTFQAWPPLSSANSIMLTHSDDNVVCLGDFWRRHLSGAVIRLTHSHTGKGHSELRSNIWLLQLEANTLDVRYKLTKWALTALLLTVLLEGCYKDTQTLQLY